MSPWFSDALLRAQSDERLVMLARAGHERAFVAIVERYRRPLHAFTRRLVPEGRVEDVLQQAFMSAWAALCGGAEVRHLRGWLHQIVRHAAIAVAAAPGDEPLPETIVGEGGPEAEVELRLLVRETLDNVARLPDHQRAAVVKTAMEGRSREEVASSLGVTEGAVRGLLHRARTTLRAAATAVTPMPLAAWAAGGRGPGVEHVAELVAGAGSASLAGAGVKAGTVVAVSGAVAGGLASDRAPVRHHVHRDRPTVVAARPHAASAPVSLTRARAAPAAPREHPAVHEKLAAARSEIAAPAPAPRHAAPRPAPRTVAPAPRHKKPPVEHRRSSVRSTGDDAGEEHRPPATSDDGDDHDGGEREAAIRAEGGDGDRAATATPVDDDGAPAQPDQGPSSTDD